MKIERLKSILLVLLVISSIVLTVNKWFNEKLWPEGYNFFSDVKKHFVQDQSATSSFDPVEEILKPAKIILNNSGNHVLYTKSSDEYNDIFAQIKSALKLLSQSESALASDDAEWNENLKRKSCYFSYPVEYDSGYFFYQLSHKYSGPVTSVCEFILSKDSRVSTIFYMYVRDASTGVVHKYRLTYESDVLDYFIDNAVSASDGTDYYSFELNFDSEAENSVEEHIVIDPDVLINISQKQILSIGEQNIFIDVASKPQIYNDILHSFGYNTSTIRRYTEPDNSMVFVENYGTLKLHTDGIIDYKSLNSAQGVALNGDSVYECINSCITFVNDVTGALGLSDVLYYEISSDIKDAKSKSFILNFDYYINDCKIVFSNDVHSLNHAITVEVSDGKIISYKQICKDFFTMPYPITYPSAIDAIDMLEAEADSYTGKISDLFMAYTFDMEKALWNPQWFIENSNGEISTVPMQPEV
ncbi:MAG: hypothetical protein IKV73_00130 [Clostridia bacterium]|nr:hypothetical protein [Clostridia bacterium]